MRGVAWWVPIVLIITGLGTLSVAPIPITEVKVGNETVKITIADIMYRYIWNPVKKGMEKTLSHVPGFVRENITESIKEEFDRLERNIVYLLQLDIVKTNWQTIVQTIKELNFRIAGEYSTKVTLCVWKGIFEYCRTYELNPETPEITFVSERKLRYLTFRIPFGILKEINEKIEEGEYEALIKLITKHVIRGELELERISMEEMVKEMREMKEHMRRHRLI